MINETLRKLFQRDLSRLRKEIETYKDERNIWKVEKEIPNSAGNLCLHLVGNLNAFIGKEIGKTNYVRNRELEFSAKNVPREELLKQVDDTITVVDHALSGVSDADLEQQFPVVVFDQPTSTGYMLIHLATHLSYHLGQVNYHRRLLD